ncbi:MAG: DUF6941 family protein [Janthinobacterium lividum]
MADESPYGYTAFCDDIRFELDDKQSLIGLYSSLMHAASFPLLLPKFAFYITLMEPSSLAYKRDFSFTITIELPGGEPDVPVIIQEIPAPDGGFHETPHPFTQERETLYIRTTHIIVTTGLIIKEPGLIKVRIRYGDEVIKCGTLAISPIPAV